MERLTDVLQRLPGSPETDRMASHETSTTTPRPSERAKSLVELVFAKLSATYGNKLAEAYSGQKLYLVKAEWAQVIEPFGVDAIRVALKLARGRHPDWPPTLGQFEALCRSVRPPDLPKLPAPRTAPPAGVFERMRAAIGLATTEGAAE